MKTQTLNIPHSIEAEQAVLGGIMLNNDHWDNIAERIQPHDFYTYAHRIIFEQMSKLAQLDQPIDILTLDQALKSAGVLKNVGGFAYIAELSKNTPSAANILAYTNIVSLYSKHRQLLALGQYIVGEAQSQTGKSPEKLDELLENIEKRFTDLTLSQQSNDPPDFDEALGHVLSKMELSAKYKDPVTGTPTGIRELDEVTTGGQPGELIMIGARPSMGKTALSQVIAYHTLEKFKDNPLFFYSMEMPVEQIAQRFLAMVARVSLQSIRKADCLSDTDWGKLAIAMKYIQEQNWKERLIIDDGGGLSIQSLRSKVRRSIRKYGTPSAIIIDYLQLLRGSRRYENRNLEVSDISQSLKKLAKEVGCPVYVLSQLNRNLENRQNKRPVNADLRESGSLEQDADLIMFIYRDEIYNENSEFPGIAEIILSKQRNGPLKTVRTRFLGEYCLFDNFKDDTDLDSRGY